MTLALARPRGSLSAVRPSGESKGPVKVGGVVVARVCTDQNVIANEPTFLRSSEAISPSASTVVVARGEAGSRPRAPRHSAEAATKALIVPSHTPARRSFFNEWSGAGRSARPKEACGPLRSGTRLGLRTRGYRACFDRALSSAPLPFQATAQSRFRRHTTNG